jgi:hypothetical protein
LDNSEDEFRHKFFSSFNVPAPIFAPFSPKPATPSAQEIPNITETRYSIIPFTHEDMLQFNRLLSRKFKSQLFCDDESQKDDLEEYIRGEIQYYRSVYLNGDEGEMHFARNAMTFYFAFLRGLFMDAIHSVIIVCDNYYTVIGFDAKDYRTEVDILFHLENIPGDAFLIRGCGYWKSFFYVGKRKKLLGQGRQIATGRRARIAILPFDEETGCCVKDPRVVANSRH